MKKHRDHLNSPKNAQYVIVEMCKVELRRSGVCQTLSERVSVLPRRWVVERTFAWLDRQWRLSKDYELLPEASEAWMYLANARLLRNRAVKLCS